MKSRTLTVSMISVFFTLAFALSAFCQQAKPIKLPEPKLDASKSLAQALKERKTTRAYSETNLSEQTLSNLLWAGFGINRPDSGKRTAPSALNWQEIDIYVATPKGIYLYDPKGNALIPVISGDHRSLTYTQVDRFKDAPVDLVYIADLSKTGKGEESQKTVLVGMDTGFIAENVYLYCASEGLPTGYRVSIDKDKLAKALKLKPTQRIMGAQSVGLPKGK
ncbi:MAG: SagB/ThcOx family dehydrogenase [Desulfomonilaceae bacterium]